MLFLKLLGLLWSALLPAGRSCDLWEVVLGFGTWCDVLGRGGNVLGRGVTVGKGWDVFRTLWDVGGSGETGGKWG